MIPQEVNARRERSTSPARAGLETVTVAELAAAWRVHRSTIYRWIADGKLPAVKINRTTRLLVRDVAAFLEAHRTT